VLAALAWLAFGSGTPRVRVAYAELNRAAQAPASEVLTGSGYVVTGDRYISLGVRVPSRIEAYLVEEGQEVSKGQPLVKLDARQYDAALRETRASLESARANVELRVRELARAEEMHQQRVSSDWDLDLKQNQLRVAKAEVARLEAEVARRSDDLEDTVVRATTNGVVLEKFKEVGEIAVPGGFAGSGELIRMANLEDLRAEVDVNEADLSRISLGQPANVTPDAYQDKRYAAEVVKLYPQINRQKGTLKVEVRIREPDEWLRPDMSVRISFLSKTEPMAAGASEATPVVLAPADAVRGEGPARFAWVVTDGHLRKQALEVSGTTPDGRAVVARGLAGGEALVVGEAGELEEGRAVEVDPSR
jgi:HlyD family secretion protein